MSINLGDFAPSIPTLVLFALYALLVIPLLKFGLTKWQVPGLSALAAAI